MQRSTACNGGGWEGKEMCLELQADKKTREIF